MGQFLQIELKKDSTSTAIILLVGYAVALILLISVGMLIGRALHRKRNAARVAWGERHGLRLLDPSTLNEKLTTYGDTEIGVAILSEYEGHDLAEKQHPMARNILEGVIDGFKIRVFDYRYVYGIETDLTPVDHSIVAIEFPGVVHTMSFQSRRFKDGIPKDLDLPFDRKEFNDRFHVFQDEGHLLALKMDSGLEKRLIDSPVYKCDAYGRFLLVRAANKISEEKFEVLLAVSRELAKLISQ